MLDAAAKTGPHVLTFNLEDYFQVGAFNRYVRRGHWDRFETRLEHHTQRTLDLLDQYQAKATFFVLGWVAEHHPQLVRAIAERGHEIASRGYWHRNIRDMAPREFRAELAAARNVIESVCGRRVVGYRAADGWFGPNDLWALDMLADEGYVYDSSIAPVGRHFGREAWRRVVHAHATQHGAIWELPVSTARWLGHSLPLGGNWIRQLPARVMLRAAERFAAAGRGPLVLYFHTWELDNHQPRLSTAGWFTRRRQYRNLDLMENRVKSYLERFTFIPAADWLGVPRPIVVPVPMNVETPPPMLRPTLASIDIIHRKPVTVVVPLYNEEETIGYLANTLDRVRKAFESGYETAFILVDDGSKDATWAKAQAALGARGDVRLLQHDRNQGVAAAIMTGLRAATTGIVCSIDADCSYDPLVLLKMIPKLVEGVDLVTASPYHPEGGVSNVPGWRLFLSKGASRLYRRVFHNRLHTYTSCVRVYRRDVVKDIPVEHGNFLGVVELLGRLDQAGSRIVEHPALLETRVLGRSKMKTARTIIGHLNLMTRFALGRMKPPPKPRDVLSEARVETHSRITPEVAVTPILERTP
jgi:polysaccharide deacetylase family protein (PEP-CTERM system associated)